MNRFLVLIPGLFLILASCGGAAPEAEPVSDVGSSDTVRLTGRVDVPPLEALPALQSQMSALKAAKGEEPAKGIKGDLYTLDGKHLGGFETSPGGDYHLDVPAEALAGGQEVILSTTGGIQKYQDIGSSGGSKTVNLGAADVITTLATQGMVQQLEGFSGWGKDYSGTGLKGKLGCLYQIEETLWTDADPDSQTLTQNHGLLKQLVVALIAHKKDSSDPAFDDWHSILNGILTSDEAGQVYVAVEDLLSDLIEEDQDGDLCKGMADSKLDPGALLAPIVAAKDLEELNAVYSHPAAVKIHVGLMKDCVDQDGCAGVKEDAATILGVMKAYEGEYEGVFDEDGKLDTDALKEIIAVAKTCDDSTGKGKSECIKEKVEEGPASKKAPEAPKKVPVKEEDDPPPEPKVTVCHIPPGNPENAHTLEIGASALPAHLAHGDYEGGCAPSEFSVLWQYTFGKIYGGFYRMIPGPSAAIGEVRPDLTGLEIATGNEEFYPLGSAVPQGRWFLFQPDGAIAFWKDTENDEAHSSVNLYDLDDDGRLELLGGTTSGNQVQAIDGDGDWVWRYFLSGHSISTPTVAKLTAEGIPMVFNGCMDNKVRSIDGKTGTLNWAFDTGRWIWSTPAVADLDGDTHKEIVVANDGQYYGNGTLYSLDAETGHLNWQNNLGKKVRASPATADLDGDGVLEVLIGDGSGVFKAFDGKTGALKWSFATGGEILSSAAIGDLDGDGDLEAVFGSADGKVYALHGNGSLFWSRNLGGAVHSSPALARRNPGGPLHAYVATMSGSVDVLNGLNGNLASRLIVGYEVVSSPVVGDVDGDGKLEVFFQDRRADHLPIMAGDVFWAIRDEGSSVPAFSREWPLFRGDPAHTGVYPHNGE